MRNNRLLGRRTRRPMLFALVFGVVLVLVGVTGSALVAVASSHVSAVTLSNAVSRDASLVELFVNATLRADDVDEDGPSPARVGVIGERLAALARDDGILHAEIRNVDGVVIAASDPAAVGAARPSAAMRAVLADGAGTAALVGRPAEAGTDAWAPTDPNLVQEYLPIVDADNRPIAVVALWRDATELLAGLESTRRDIMLVTLAAGVLLAGLLFLVFRAAQARLTGQQRQLVDATRRDALTGMLNHGTVVGVLADAVEATRERSDELTVVLLDIDNFRLFNDTHGHDAADEVLHRVAEVVSAEASAVAGRHAARYGPDEFLLVLPGSGVDVGEAAVGRIRAALESLGVRFGDSEELPISVSAGIATVPAHATAVTELLSAAAVALGEAKASGGDGVRVFRAAEEDRTVIGGFDILQGLVIAVDTKDRYTKRHSEDVARYAVFLARRLGLDDDLQRTIQLAGLLHDVGKIGIPDVVLRKPSKLTADEYGMFQQHVALGDAIVRDVPNVELVRAGIRHHHERWDGGGYLEGLEGEAIPLIGRILAVADAFSAMTTTRPYRKALPLKEALSRLEDAAGSQLQEGLVAAFVEGIETAADAPLPGEDAAPLWRPELWVA